MHKINKKNMTEKHIGLYYESAYSTLDKHVITVVIANDYDIADTD